MAENQDGQEKKHDPSAQRLRDAARKGQTPRSTDLNSVAVLVTASMVLIFAMGVVGDPLVRFAIDRYTLQGRQTLDMQAAAELLATAMATVGLAIAFPLGAIVLAGTVAALGQSGAQVANEALEPKFERLDPIQGFKSQFMSWNPLVELGKGVGKLLLMAVASVAALWTQFDRVPMFAAYDPIAMVHEVGRLVLIMLAAIFPLILALAIADYAYMRWKTNEDLKMTDQELKDQMKQSEGDPKWKQQRRARARQIAMGTMIGALREADVVVTNPTHYAVAIRYDRERDWAPVVVAKGVDHLALKIRRAALDLSIPRIENRPLARGLYARVQVGQPIPEDLFGAVAKVLATVYRRRMKGRRVRQKG